MDEFQNKKIIDEFTYFTPYSVDVFNYDQPAKLEEYMSKFRDLAGKIKDIAFDFSTAEFVQDNLVPNFNLQPEQGREVTRIIRDILLSSTFIGDMPKEIQSKLNVDQNTANQITSKIVSELFALAIEEIKQAQATAFPNRVASAQPTENRPISPTVDLRNPPQTQLPKDAIYNPAASLDVNKNNVLDLRNK